MVALAEALDSSSGLSIDEELSRATTVEAPSPTDDPLSRTQKELSRATTVEASSPTADEDMLATRDVRARVGPTANFARDILTSSASRRTVGHGARSAHCSHVCAGRVVCGGGAGAGERRVSRRIGGCERAVCRHACRCSAALRLRSGQRAVGFCAGGCGAAFGHEVAKPVGLADAEA